MSAVISGNGLGLFGTSLSQLSYFTPGAGRNDGSYVNAANGNLILQAQDEQLMYRGMNAAFLRTYNSQATLSQAGADAWVTGFERRVQLTAGSLNVAGSRMSLQTGDGAFQDFDYVAPNTYVSTAGGGAHDTLTWNSTTRTWAYVEGSSRREETYADHADAALLGRLTRIRDLRTDGSAPVTWDVLYNAANAVSEVRSADGTATGDALVFGYDANGRLHTLSTREGGRLLGQVGYEYDSAGRLSAVVVDLTPEDGVGDRETWDFATAANNNGYLFRTTYTYVDSTSLRISQVRRSDGTLSSYTYDAAGRIATATQGDVNANDADGLGQTLTFAYDTAARSTSVSDSAGRTWTYLYDTKGQVSQVLSPALAGQRDVTAFNYDGAGNVTRVTTTRGAVVVSQTDSQYDANGNLLWQWETVAPSTGAAARAVQRTYTATNQLASETVFSALDSDGASAAVPTGGSTTNFIYDAQDRLRFVVNATGDVRELEYATSGNGVGQVWLTRQYLGSAYAGAYTLSALTAWATPSQKASSTVTESTYDIKGRLAQARSFAAVDAAGAGIEDDSTQITQYAYDAQGLLRQSVSLRSSTAAANDGRDSRQVCVYTYDGMGRLLSESVSDQVGVSAPVVLRSSTWSYMDSAGSIRTVLEGGAVGDGNTANDLLRVEARDASGQLISISESALSGGTTRVTRNYYDSTGRLRATQDAGGARTYLFYDAKGDVVGQVDPTGSLVETMRDALGRVIETRAYGIRLDTSTWLSGNTVVPQSLDAVRPGWNVDFSAVPVPQLDTSMVNSATYVNGITTQAGRLAFRVSDNAATAYPSISTVETHRLNENVAYSAEVTTDAALSNTYMLFGLQNTAAWASGSRRASAYFRNGTLYLNTVKDGVGTDRAIGTLQANTTYVVEVQTRDGGIDYSVYIKGQDKATGFSFSADAESADWGATRLMVYGLMQPGVTGNALYLDNLSLNDPALRRSLRSYDGSGRVLTETDPQGTITTYTYDGAGRLLQTRATDAAGTGATARTVRYFQDAAGRDIARLDAEGYLVEYGYDRAGRRISTTAYATVTPAALRASGTLAQLRPATSAADQNSRVFYDGRGQVLGELDAEGYLTEYVYDEARNQRAVRRYGTQLKALTGTETLATLRGRAGNARETRRAFDARGLLLTELNPEGTVTRYSYDAQGQLLKAEAAQGTLEQRDALRRYDVFGNLIGELSGEGAARVSAGMTAAQIDAVYAQYGVRHDYDALGRRIESTDPHGNKTWYFYDAAGRATHVVRGVADAAGVRNALGEVVETRYTAFGEVRDSIAYTGRIAIASPFGRTQVSTAVQTLRYLAATDSRTQYDYDRAGRVRLQVDALGNRSSWLYSAFGDMVQERVQTDATRITTSSFAYDLRGQRRSQVGDVGGIARTQSWTYDAFGRVATATDARNVTTSFGYDRLGRQVQQQRTVSGRIEQVSVSYDAWDRVATQTDALGRVTRYAYDDTARSVVVTTPEGVVTTAIHNRHGQAESVTDALGNRTSTQYNRDGRVGTATDATLASTQQTYDERGLLFESQDATGRKVRFEYDAAGRVTARIEDPAGLALTTRYSYDGQGRQISVTDPTGSRTTFAYDTKGQLLETVQDADGLALRTTYTWDARGLQLTVTEGAGSATARKTAYGYDALGRRITETVAPGTLNLITRYDYDANDNVTARTDAANRVTRYTYDEAGRRIHSVDGAGGVVRNWYDVNGRLVATRGYAAAISLSGLPTATNVAAIDALVAANDAADLQQFSVYDQDGRARLSIDGAGAVALTSFDAASRQIRVTRYANAASLTPALRAQLQQGTAGVAGVLAGVMGDPARDQDDFLVLDAAGRMRFTVASDGAVTEMRYDGAGRTVQTLSYPTALVLTAAERTQLAAGTWSDSAVAARVAPQAPAARIQATVYDGAGRERYSLQRLDDGRWSVLEQSFDSAGRALAQTAYGVSLPPATTLTDTAVQQAVQAALSTDPAVRATQVRTTRYVLDTAGRRRFTLDATGAVTEARYDAAGRVVETRAFANRPGSALTTESQLDSWSRAQAAADVRVTQTGYDAAGRAETVTDDVGKVERYVYDGTGQVTQYTDRNNAVWNYEYDGAGRRTVETSPTVVVATVNAAGVVSQASRRLVTRTDYDGQGNVTRRTENADTSEARVTEYFYDNRGHQTRTLFPDAWRINESTGELEATGQRPSTEVVYDTLGRAVVQKDVRGYYSYRVYDAKGNVSHEIDPEGYVTAYGYDAFGQRTTLRRYATAMNSAPLTGWSAGKPLSAAQMATAGVLTVSPDDRVITTLYDSRGHARQVQQTALGYYNSAGQFVTGTPTNQFEYDAFGQLVKESVLLEGTAGQAGARWADAYRFYDSLGHNVLTVDAEGYATGTRYNATGDVIETVEYARALPDADRSRGTPPAAGDVSTGYDRVTRWQYDALGRRSVETVVRRYQRTDGSAGVRNVDTTFNYDNEGHVTGVTNDAGTTVTRYDQLGRVLSVQEPTRASLTASFETGLLASTGTDVGAAGLYEQASPYTAMLYDAFGNVVQTRRYANGLRTGEQSPVADDSRDQVDTTRYDRQGRSVMARTGEGTAIYSAYDEADHVLHTWYALAGSDDTGRTRDAVVHGRYTYDRAGRQTSATQTRTLTAGGTVTDTGETVSYNAFGEIRSKNYTGVAGTLSYGYDTGGHMVSSNQSGAVREIGYNLAGHQVRESHKAYIAAGNIVDAVTWSVTDRLGRAVSVRLPSHTTSTSNGSTIEQQFDRWGNVLQMIDARGFQTNYRYNDFNQVTRDERPLVEVVSETGARSWVRPVNEWYYDANGRLLGTRDANGNLRTNEYDAAGRLIRARDAYGNATTYAYDVLGNQRLVQNALGYITFKAYDREGRVASIGDYLPGATGTTRARTILQRYRLNANGDRLSVTDALGNTALYDYDSRSQLVRSQTSMGLVMQYAFDATGHRTLERYPRVTDESVPDRWVEEEPGVGYWEPGYVDDGTRVDRENETVRVDENTWDYDAFGRVVDHNNLSARDSDYSYDSASGQLISETGAGGAAGASTRSITYFVNGRIREISENGGANVFRYEYDAAGNRTVEETTTRDGSGRITHTLTRTQYDSHNRIQRVTQDDLSGTPKRVFDLSYSYDAVGNRRQVRAVSGYGGNVAAVPTTNTAPVAVQPVADRIVRTDLTSQFTLLVSDIFRDAEQDPLTYSVTQSNGAALPAWLTAQQDPATGKWVFTANPGASLNNTDVVVRLSARETATPGNVATVDFVVKVRTNTGPEIIGPATEALRIKTGQNWTMEIPSSQWFRDADVGDRLTLTIDNPSPNPLPWAQIDATNPSVIRLAGTPVAGTYTLRVRATDEKGAFVVKTFQITAAANATPQVVAAPGAQEAILGRDFNWTRALSGVFSDADGDALRVTAAGLPSWLSFQYLVDQATPELKITGRVPADEVDGRSYAVVLTATDPDGASRTTTLNVVVRANRAPMLSAPGGWALPAVRVGDALDRTVLISTLFTDPDNDQIFIEPLWPTGSTLPQWLKITVDQAAGTIRFYGTPTTNAQAGALSFQLRGRDAEGLSNVANVSISIATDTAPTRNTAVSVGNQNLSIGRSFSFTLPANMFTDADAGDVLSLSAQVVVQQDEQEPGPNGTVMHLYWVDQQALPSWLTFDAASRTFSGTVPAGTSPQTLRIRVRAFDGRHYDALTAYQQDHVGSDSTLTDSDFAITLAPFVNTPPSYSAGSLPNRTGVEGQPVNFSLPAGAFTEPNGDALTYSALIQNESGAWVTPASIGLSINAANGQITGTPTSLRLSSYNVRIYAADPQGASAYGQFVLTVNRVPAAPPSLTRTVSVNQTFNYAVTGFSDPEGGALTYTARLSGGAALPAWMSFTSAGLLSGTPTAPSSYSIVVTATDSAGLTSSTVLTLTVANDPPVYNGGLSNQAPGAGTAFSYTVPGTAFTDANGDALTFTADANGAALPAWLTFNAATRTFSGTPRAAGSWTIRVMAADASGINAVGSFVLTVANVAPTNPVALPARTGNQGQAVNWTLPNGAFVDANNDTISYSLMVERPGYWETYYIAPGEPDVRWVEPQWVVPSNAGLSVNASTGAVTGTLSLLYGENAYRAKIIARDPAGATVEAVFSIGVNRAPTSYATTENVSANSAFSRTIRGFSDPDGETLTYSATLVGGAPLPAWLTLTSAGVLSGTAPAVATYQLQVTARDASGATTSAVVTLAAGNAPPQYNAGTIPSTLNGNATVGFSYQIPAGAFTDPNGDALSYTAYLQQWVPPRRDPEGYMEPGYWDSVALPPWLTFNAATRTLSSSAPVQGSYQIQFWVTDPSGYGAECITTLAIGAAPNYAPTPPALTNQSAGRNQYWAYTIPAFSDANGDALTYTASGMPAGVTFNASTRTFSGTPTALGTSTITVTANDGRGGVGNASFTLTVGNSAPVPTTPPAQTTTAGVAWGYTLPAFSDPNGDALTYSVSGLPAWMSFTPASRYLSGTPSAVGSWTITVTATDPSGASASTSFTVTTPNSAPTAAAGIPAQTVGKGQSWSYQFAAGTFADANGDALSYSATGLPPGIAFDGASRTFYGAPTVLGSYTVTVTASDGRGGTVSTSFAFNVGNSAPVYAAALPARGGQQGQGISWGLPAGSFTDANGDALSYSMLVERPGYWETYYIAPGEPDVRWVDPSWVAASYAGLSIDTATGTVGGTLSRLYGETNYRAKIIARDPSGATAEGIFNIAVNVAPTAPALGTLTARQNAGFSYTLPAFSDANGDALAYGVSGLPAGLAFDAATRVISGTPTGAGNFTVTYSANDGRGGSAAVAFTLTVQANNAPVAPAIGNMTTGINNPWSFTVPAFSDADYDILSYSVSGMPAGLSFNAGTRVISGTPAVAGAFTIYVTANDGRGGVTATSFVLTVSNTPPANRAPVVNQPLETQYADTGVPFVYVVPSDSFVDPDGNPLSYTATLSTGAALPAWLRFDPASRRFSGTPTGLTNSTYTIRVTVADPSGLSVSATFTLYKTGSGGGGGGGGQIPLRYEPATKSMAMSAAPVSSDTATAGSDTAQVDVLDPSHAALIMEPPDNGGDPPPPAPSVPYQVTEYWFTYDAENRLKINNGKLVGGQIVVDGSSSDSYELLYDAAGHAVARYQRIVSGTSTIDQIYRTAFDLRGNKTLEFHAERVGVSAYQTGGVSKSFTYDAVGQLRETRSYYANGSTRSLGRDAEGMPRGTLNISGWLSGAEQLDYDRDGRLLTQLSKQRTDTNWSRYADDYETGTSPGPNQRTDLSVLADKTLLENRTAAGASGYDAAGRLATYRYTQIGTYTHTYSSTFVGWDSFQEAWVNGVSTNTNYRTTANTLVYDTMGRLVSQREHTNYQNVDDRIRYYAYTGDGRVQMRRSGTLNSSGVFVQTAAADGSRDNALFVHAGGQQQAELKEGGQTRMYNGAMYDTAQLQSLGGIGNYTAGGGKVTVGAGENLQALAQRIYGTSTLWYVLADANGLSDPGAELIEGTQLNAPSVGVSRNDAGTFKPYNPGDTIGSTTPSLPYITPPPKKSCNALAMVLMVVVAIAVTVFTAGALTGLAAAAIGQVGSAMLVGAIAGAAGSIAGQLVGMATGVVDQFSWRQVAAGAITGAITGGIAQGLSATKDPLTISAALKAGDYGKVAILAVTNSAAGYVGNKLAGVPGTSFSWRSIAAGAVANVVSAGIGNALNFNPTTDLGKFGANMAQGVIGGVVSAHTRKLFGIDEDINYGKIVLDAFGNALGNVLGGAALGELQKAKLNHQVKSIAAESGIEFAGHDERGYYTEDVLRDADGVLIKDSNGRSITIKGYHSDQFIRGAIATGATHDEVVETTRSSEMRSAIASFDSAAAIGDSSLIVRRPVVTVGPLVIVDRNGVPAPSGPTPNDETQVIVVTARSRSQNIDEFRPGDVAANVMGLLAKGGNSLAEFDNNHPFLSSIAINGTQAAIRGGGVGTVLVKTAQGVFSDTVDRGLEWVGDKAKSYLMQLGVNETTAGILSQGGVFGASALFGSAGSVKTQAHNVERELKQAPEELRSLAPNYHSAQHQARIDHPKLDSVSDLGPVPSGMKNPHDHHVLQLNGRPGDHRAMVREGQDILREYGIDPVRGVENRVWAPNKGHTTAATEALLGDLRAAQQAGASRATIVDILKQHGAIAARR